MDVQPFKQLIVQLLDPNNEIRRSAEEQLSKYRKASPDQLVLALCALIGDQSLDKGFRQLAANLLKKDVLPHPQSSWKIFTPETKQSIQFYVLELLKTIQQREILRELSSLGASLAAAKHTEEKTHWQELFTLLAQWTTSQLEIQREIAMSTFADLLRLLTKKLSEFFPQLVQMIQQGLQDSSVKVRIAAFSAMLIFIAMTPSSRTDFQKFIPHLFDIVGSTLNRDEEEARNGLILLNELAEIDPDFFQQEIDQILEGTYNWVISKDLENATMFHCAELIVTLAESKPSYLRKRIPFLDKFVLVLLQMMSKLENNPNWQLGEEHDCEDEQAAVAGSMLDRLSLSIGEPMVPVIFSKIPSMLQSENWKIRHAALTVISLVAEGCAEVLSENLGEIVKSVLNGFHDQHERVRWASCNTIGQMSTDFSPQLQEEFPTEILQSLIGVMDDVANPRVQSHAASAVINFSDGCDEDVLFSFAPTLLSKLGELIAQQKLIVLEQAITAVSSVAECIKEKFTVYYDTFVPYYKTILFEATSQEHKKLRGKAIEGLSVIAAAVQQGKFQPDAKPILDLLVTLDNGTLPADDPQIASLSRAWGRFARALGPDFAPYLPAIMPRLLDAAAGKAKLKVFTSDDEINEDYSLIEVDNYTIGIKTSAVQEKSSALNNIFWLVSSVKEPLVPYVEKILEVAVQALQFVYDEEVRNWGAGILPELLKCFPQQPELALQMFHNFLNSILEAITNELDVDSLITLLEALQASVDAAGKGCLALENRLGMVYSVLKKVLDDFLLKRRAIFSRLESPEVDSEDRKKLEKAADRQATIIYYLAEAIGSCLKTHGEQALQYINEIYPPIFSFMKELSRPTEKHIAVCFWDDFVEFGTVQATPIYQPWIPFVLEFCASTDADLAQAAVYGIGVLAEKNPEVFSPIALDTLRILSEGINAEGSRKKKRVRVTENAIAAFGKVLQFHGNSVNLTQFLPMWFNFLPVTEDEETVTIYQQLCHFFLSHTELILGENFVNLPKLLAIFVEVLGTSLINSQTEQNIVQIVKRMQNEFPAEPLRNAWGILTPAQQEKLRAASGQ